MTKNDCDCGRCKRGGGGLALGMKRAAIVALLINSAIAWGPMPAEAVGCVVAAAVIWTGLPRRIWRAVR